MSKPTPPMPHQKTGEVVFNKMEKIVSLLSDQLSFLFNACIKIRILNYSH